MLIYLLLRIINFAIDAYLAVLFIRMLLDWASILFPRWYPRGFVAELINAVYMATAPPLRWLRHGCHRIGCQLYGAVLPARRATSADLTGQRQVKTSQKGLNNRRSAHMRPCYVVRSKMLST